MKNRNQRQEQRIKAGLIHTLKKFHEDEDHDEPSMVTRFHKQSTFAFRSCWKYFHTTFFRLFLLFECKLDISVALYFPKTDSGRTRWYFNISYTVSYIRTRKSSGNFIDKKHLPVSVGWNRFQVPAGVNNLRGFNDSSSSHTRAHARTHTHTRAHTHTHMHKWDTKAITTRLVSSRQISFTLETWRILTQNLIDYTITTLSCIHTCFIYLFFFFYFVCYIYTMSCETNTVHLSPFLFRFI